MAETAAALLIVGCCPEALPVLFSQPQTFDEMSWRGRRDFSGDDRTAAKHICEDALAETRYQPDRSIAEEHLPERGVLGEKN
ncbi:MAG: hypothetical protein QOK17_1222 [Sphingomonadales bacterium]|jgi:hypothetical protein|nr:hypothetical protein [Sphingomonadales bacterium]